MVLEDGHSSFILSFFRNRYLGSKFSCPSQHFDEAELEWLIGGLPTIDAGDW